MFNEETAIKPAKFSHNRLIKFIACILVFALLFTSLPSESFNFSAKAEEDDVYVVKEVEDYRTQNSKTYLKSDGSMTGIISSEALHFKEGNEWKEIDNTLSETENGYKNTAGELNITLPNELDTAGAVTVSNSEYSISFSPVGIIKSASGKVKNISQKADKSKYKDMTPAEITEKSPTSGSMTYSGVYENSDIHYDVQSNKLKESIILDKKPNKHLKYTYTVTAKGLSAELLDNNVIEFFTGEGKTREVVFTMPAPFMFDSENVTSYDITVNLEKESDGIYTLTYTPNTDWLRDKERAYPVTIDPTVITGNATEDTYTSSYDPYLNFPNDPFLYVGSKYRSYLKFNSLPELPEDYIIVKANLKLCQASSATGYVLKVGQIDNDCYWDTASSHFQLDHTNPPDVYDYKYVTVNSLDSNDYLSIDIKYFYNNWHKGRVQNNGLMLSTDSDSDSTTAFYHSLESDYKPYIEVEYADVTNENVNQTSRTMDVGRAGTVHINDVTGNMTLVRNDIAAAGNIMPVSISMIYNTKDAGKVLFGSGSLNAYGSGFRTNYSQTLKFVTVTSTHKYYEYVDENGYKIRFMPNNDTTATEPDELFVNEDSGYTLYVDTADKTNPSKAYIIDGSGNKYLFDNYSTTTGRLVKIVGCYPTTNFEQTLSFTAATEEEPASYTFTNYNGQEIRFERDIAQEDITSSTNREEIFLNVSGGSEKLYVGDDVTKIATAYVTDSAGNKFKFNSTGTLLTVTDKNNVVYTKPTNTLSTHAIGTIEIHYNTNNAIDKIIDGIGRSFKFTYDTTKGLLSSISLLNKNGTTKQSVSYGYDNPGTGKLYNFTCTDGKKVYYGWDWTHHNLITIKNYDGYHFKFTYNYGTETTVKTIEEYGTAVHGNPLGQSVSVAYHQYSTLYTYSSGKTEIVRYNQRGAITSNTDTNGNTVFNKYIGNTTNPYLNNQLVYVSNPYHEVRNLLKNGYFAENTANWVTGSATLNYGVKKFGNQSLMLYGSETVYQTVSLDAGTYTYSGYFHTSGSGAKLTVTDANGSMDGITVITDNRETSPTGEWERAYITFELSTNKTLRFGAKKLSSEGTVCFDGAQLEAHSKPSRFNLVENSAFEQNMSYWTVQSGTANTNVGESAVIFDGGYRLGIKGNVSSQSRVYQDVKVAGAKGDEFSFGGFAMAEQTSGSDNAKLAIAAQFYNGDTALGEIQYADIDIDTSHFAFEMSAISAPAEYTKLRIYLVFDNEAGYGYFDCIQLYKAKFGTAIEPTSEEEETEDSEIVGATEENPIVSNKTTETTDALGNNLSSTKTNGRFSITTSNAYTENGNFQTSTTDELGNVTSYEYNEITGNLDSVTNAEGIKTSYTYNSAGNPTKMTVTGADGTTAGTINYSYDSSDRLTGVDANTDYTYTYNAFGTATGVKVGSTQLVSYNYSGAASGNYLNSITYGNGQTVSFTYDADHNLTTVKGNGGSYKYIYDEVGNLSAIIDYTNQTKTKYTYDADGNTTVTTTLLDSDYFIHSYENKSSSFKENVRGTEYTTVYSNDENPGTNWKVNGVNSVSEIYYDDLDRLSSESVYRKTDGENSITSPVYTKSYAYTDRAGYLTSNQTSLISLSANGYQNSIVYTYDNVGNITRAGDISYEYDSLGQIVRVNDPKYGTTVYVYDVGGNIKYVKSYDYTVGELGAVKNTETYSYGNTKWKDLLTSYNGETITYDEIGNPIYYYTNDKFNWSMGRQLSSISFTNGTSAYYSYNYDGLRTQKKNYSEEEYAYYSQTDYTWVDGKITSMLLTDFGDEKCTHAKIYIRYDESDKPIALEYNGEEYYYVTNLQGDVIAILDKNGNCVVEYTYDAWGRILSTTGTLATTLGQDNPLRYRGYYYDTETGFYYLQSRYYDPSIGRFINADEIGYLGVNGTLPSYNLFAYCENNPVNNADPTGQYNRNLAVAYALKWYNGRNSLYYSYSSDCANFVSQCLYAGGIGMTNLWHSRRSSKSYWYNSLAWIISKYRYNWDISSAWRRAPDQYNYFSNKCNGYTKDSVIKVTTKTNVKNLIKKEKVQVGDLLYFVKKNKSKPYHATIIVDIDTENGKIYYAGHTTNRRRYDMMKSIGSGTAYIVKLKNEAG